MSDYDKLVERVRTLLTQPVQQQRVQPPLKPGPPMDRDGVMNVLNQHMDKNFVQRIASPHIYPRLYDGPDGMAGDPSTHSMAADVDGNGDWFVYPTVIQDKDGNLKRLPVQEAFKHARDTGERIPFGKDKDTAIWFSSDEGYKQMWQPESKATSIPKPAEPKTRDKFSFWNMVMSYRSPKEAEILYKNAPIEEQQKFNADRANVINAFQSATANVLGSPGDIEAIIAKSLFQRYGKAESLPEGATILPTTDEVAKMLFKDANPNSFSGKVGQSWKASNWINWLK